MKNKDILVFLLCLLILLFVLNYVFKFSGIGNKTFEGFEVDPPQKGWWEDCTDLTKLIFFAKSVIAIAESSNQ